MILITGASGNHAKSLVRLLESVKRYEPDMKVRVYDLGLGEYRAAVEAVGYEISMFPYDKYPDFVDITKNAGHYAWKPLIIAEACETEDDDVFWLDGGCLLSGSLDRIRETIHKNGIYSPISQGCLKDWTYPTVLDNLHVTARVRRMPNRSGGVVGVAKNSLEGRRIVTTWRRLCSDKRFICPDGSSRRNHRQDQSVLSILMAQSADRGYSKSDDGLFSVMIHQDCD